MHFHRMFLTEKKLRKMNDITPSVTINFFFNKGKCAARCKEGKIFNITEQSPIIQIMLSELPSKSPCSEFRVGRGRLRG